MITILAADLTDQDQTITPTASAQPPLLSSSRDEQKPAY
jgi:hypothetical protein